MKAKIYVRVGFPPGFKFELIDVQDSVAGGTKVERRTKHFKRDDLVMDVEEWIKELRHDLLSI